MTSLYGRVFGLVLRDPGLIPTLLGSAWAFRSRDWYKRPPFLPLPSLGYLQWRIETAYGDPGALPSAEELARFLRWAAAMRKAG